MSAIAHRGTILSRTLRFSSKVPLFSRSSAYVGAWKAHQSVRLNKRLLGSSAASVDQDNQPPRSTRLVEAVGKSIDSECKNFGPDTFKILEERGWDAGVLKTVASKQADANSDQKLQDGLESVWTSSAQVESLVEMFEESVQLHKHRGMLGYWIMDTLYPLGQWKDITYYQFSILVDDMRAMLSGLGVQPGDRVAYLGRNSIEWAATAFATWGLKAVLVPLYEEQAIGEWVHILNDSQAKVLITGTKQLYDSLEPRKTELAHLTPDTIVCVDGVDGYLRWDDFGLTNQLKKVRGDVMGKPTKRIEVAVVPARLEDAAVVCYGAGPDDAVQPTELSHGNILSNILARELIMPLKQQDVSMSFVSWANPVGLAFDLLGMVRSGGLVNVCEGRQRLRRDVMESRPSILIATAPSITVLKEQVDRDCVDKVYLWAWNLAVSSLRKQRAGDDSTAVALLNRFFSKFVIGRVKPLLGGKLSHLIFAGSRPNEEDREFFEMMGIRTTEMVHASGAAGPVAFLACHDALTMAPVGTPLPSLNLRVVDGQLHISGPSVAPRSEAARDGWGSAEAATGELAVQGGDGRVRLTGRAEHCFRLACGTEVSPTPMEDAFVRQPLLQQAVVCGEGRECSVAVLLPAFDKLQAKHKERLQHNRELTQKQLLDDPLLRSMVDRQVEQVLSALKASPVLSQEVRVKGVPSKYIVLDTAFNLEDGTLDPTGEVRRAAVLRQQAEAIDQLFQPQ